MMTVESSRLFFVFIIKILLEFGFQFLDGREAGFEVVRNGLGKLVFGDADGLGDVAESILRNELVLGFTKENSDGGIVSLAAEAFINCFEVEIQLTGELWLEVSSL